MQTTPVFAITDNLDQTNEPVSKTTFAQTVSSVNSVDPKISTVSDTGTKIDAYYDSKTAKYYLFMMASDDKQVSLTYTNSNNVEAKIDVDFSLSEELVLKDTNAGDVKVVWKQSDIPSLSVELNWTTLDEIKKDKTIVYQGNDVALDDPAGKTSFSAENVGIKGTGHRSWTYYDQKSYQIEFETNTSVLGMPEAKKWRLKSNASDDSLIRSKVAYHLSQELGVDYSIDCGYVDLWIDGEYQGIYLITETVEIDANSVNLTSEDGILVEWDENYYKENDVWFKNDELDAYLGVKDTVNKDKNHINSLAKNLNKELSEFANYLFKTDKDSITIEELEKYVDVESVTQYYVINEYLANRESVSSSWFWYKNGNSDVLHMGPMLDFDFCMNFYGSNEEVYIFQRNIFTALLACPAYRSYVDAYYGRNKAIFDELSTYATSQAQTISKSADMNYIRWNVLGKTSKNGYVNHNSWAQALKTTTEWLSGRPGFFYFPDTRGFKAELNANGDGVTFVYYPSNPNATYTFELSYLTDSNSKKKLIYPSKNSLGTYVGSQSLYVFGKKGDYVLTVSLGGQQKESFNFTLKEDIKKVMYRLYNPYTGEHFYTSDLSEKFTLEPLGWKAEGTAWIAPKKSNKPVYRLYNPYAGDHHYTTSASERDSLKKKGWRYEGVGWYSMNESEEDKVAVLRQYNPNAKIGTHNFTTDTKERDKLVKAGWKDEGTAWWACAQ